MARSVHPIGWPVQKHVAVCLCLWTCRSGSWPTSIVGRRRRGRARGAGWSTNKGGFVGWPFACMRCDAPASVRPHPRVSPRRQTGTRGEDVARPGTRQLALSVVHVTEARTPAGLHCSLTWIVLHAAFLVAAGSCSLLIYLMAKPNEAEEEASRYR